MTSRFAIAMLNALSSYDTEKEIREQYKECIDTLSKNLEVLEAFDKLFHRIDNNEKIIKLVKKLDHSTITPYQYELIIKWLENGKGEQK